MKRLEMFKVVEILQRLGGLKNNILVQEFTCERDNLVIRGTEYRPRGKGLPIAIVSHGFMASQNTVRHYAVKFAELGYVSYCFELCGGCILKGKSEL